MPNAQSRDPGRDTVPLIRRRAPRKLIGLFALAVVLLIAGRAAAPSEGATGDTLRTLNAQVPNCAATWSTGLAFDGTALIRSCWYSNVLQRIDPVTGAALTPLSLTGISDIASLTWDPTRHKLWACSGGPNVYQIDTATRIATLKFQVSSCVDGLAYDATDDTLWAGCDACTSLDHYTITGSLIHHFTGVDQKLGGHGRSGIAVQGANLYLSNSGGEKIYKCSKDLASCALVSTFPSMHRIEDLECDDVTFAPKTAIWSQDDFTTTLIAYEATPGACAASTAGTPSPTPTGGTATSTRTPTTTVTAKPTNTATVTPARTSAPTVTATPTPTATITPGGPTLTPTATNTPAPTATWTPCPPGQHKKGVC